jgi:hypothetical protein
MKWKKEFIEHLNNHLMGVQYKDIVSILDKWEIPPFEEETPLERDYTGVKFMDKYGSEKDIWVMRKKLDENKYIRTEGGRIYTSDEIKILIDKGIIIEVKENITETPHSIGVAMLQDALLPDVPQYGGNNNPFPPIRIIQHYNLPFELGNVIKYVLRNKGNKIEDLKKAIDYLIFEIQKLENANR